MSDKTGLFWSNSCTLRCNQSSEPWTSRRTDDQPIKSLLSVRCALWLTGRISSVVCFHCLLAWVSGLPKGIGETRFLMGEGGGGRREKKKFKRERVSLLQLSSFFASIFPLFPQKRLILRLIVYRLSAPFQSSSGHRMWMSGVNWNYNDNNGGRIGCRSSLVRCWCELECSFFRNKLGMFYKGNNNMWFKIEANCSNLLTRIELLQNWRQDMGSFGEHVAVTR